MSVNKEITEPIRTVEDYYKSLRDMKTEIWAFGEKHNNVCDNPLFIPHIRSVAKTYAMPADAISHLTGNKISRFNHIHQSKEDLVEKVKMLRNINQHTGCCIQRCAGMDALNASYYVTFELDKKYGTDYHKRFKKQLQYIQDYNLITIGAMTDVKGDRTKKPSAQADPDLFVHIVDRNDKGIVVRGAKAHLTGVTGAHQVMVFPSTFLAPEDKDYAVVFSHPTNIPGVTYIFGRQTNDGRKYEENDIDKGNYQFGLVGGECVAIYDNAFIPWEDVYMCGETEFALPFVESFASAHRQNYGACKAGVMDSLIGATWAMMKSNGLPKAGQLRDKLADMIFHVETIYAASLACSYEGKQTSAGNFVPEQTLANVSKHGTALRVYEVNRIAQDICGGILATLPSGVDLHHPEIGPLLDKYLQGVGGISTEDKFRYIRLIENLTGGTATVECAHGAGSLQAQKIMFLRDANLEQKMLFAQEVSGIDKSTELPDSRTKK